VSSDNEFKIQILILNDPTGNILFAGVRVLKVMFYNNECL